MYRNLTAVALRGNLGNQLFQVAAARAKQLDAAAPVVVDDRVARTYPGFLDRVLVDGSYRPARWTELAFLGSINFRGRGHLAKAIPLARTRTFIEGDLIRYDPGFAEARLPVLLYGVFQEERYFHDVADEVASSFTPPTSEQSSTLKELLRRPAGAESVAVTVRRGRDYADLGWSLPLGYYERACAAVARARSRLQFTIFGDDAEACAVVAERISTLGHVVLAARFDPPTQLQLISHHDHIVLANSTFSWWGAWLSERRVGLGGGRQLIAPSPWINATDDIVPARWKAIQQREPGDDGREETTGAEG